MDFDPAVNGLKLHFSKDRFLVESEQWRWKEGTVLFASENWCECMIQPMRSFDTHGAHVQVMGETLEPLCSLILQFLSPVVFIPIKASISVKESDLSATSPRWPKKFHKSNLCLQWQFGELLTDQRFSWVTFTEVHLHFIWQIPVEAQLLKGWYKDGRDGKIEVLWAFRKAKSTKIESFKVEFH